MYNISVKQAIYPLQIFRINSLTAQLDNYLLPRNRSTKRQGCNSKTNDREQEIEQMLSAKTRRLCLYRFFGANP